MMELKPCPFCGGKGHLSTREIRLMGMNYFGEKKIHMGAQIICGRCKSRGGLATGTIIYASDREKREGLEPLENGAVELWNRRAES
ncbi:MAG: Lar family restriction alleviation protein [Clostridiales bacterium]|nr:Lar family restriction alleviation protein [Clostridiales bacterium]